MAVPTIKSASSSPRGSISVDTCSSPSLVSEYKTPALSPDFASIDSCEDYSYSEVASHQHSLTPHLLSRELSPEPMAIYQPIKPKPEPSFQAKPSPLHSSAMRSRSQGHQPRLAPRPALTSAPLIHSPPPHLLQYPLSASGALFRHMSQDMASPHSGSATALQSPTYGVCPYQDSSDECQSPDAEASVQQALTTRSGVLKKRSRKKPVERKDLPEVDDIYFERPLSEFAKDYPEDLKDIESHVVRSAAERINAKGGVPRPENCYMLYRSKYNRVMQLRFNGQLRSQTALSQFVSWQWVRESPEVKSELKRLADIDKATHQRVFAGIETVPVTVPDRKQRLKTAGKTSQSRQRRSAKVAVRKVAKAAAQSAAVASPYLGEAAATASTHEYDSGRPYDMSPPAAEATAASFASLGSRLAEHTHPFSTGQQASHFSLINPGRSPPPPVSASTSSDSCETYPASALHRHDLDGGIVDSQAHAVINPWQHWRGESVLSSPSVGTMPHSASSLQTTFPTSLQPLLPTSVPAGYSSALGLSYPSQYGFHPALPSTPAYEDTLDQHYSTLASYQAQGQDMAMPSPDESEGTADSYYSCFPEQRSAGSDGQYIQPQMLMYSQSPHQEPSYGSFHGPEQ